MERSKTLWLAELRDEWLVSSVKSQECADYEASGILMGMRHNNNSFATNRLHVARRLTGPGKVKLWQLTSYAKNFSLGIAMITRKNHKPSVKFTCPHEILRVPKKLSSAWSWLKGLWGSAGGLYFPKAGYYLTLIISDEHTSEITRNAINLTSLSWSEHRHEFTLRNHEDIITFLYNMGITSGALGLENMAIIRSARSKANTMSNYDSANIMRSFKAAQSQKIIADMISESGMLVELPDKLREIVELRLRYPELSLEELGEKLTPRINKSAVKYRWVRIQNLIKNFNSNVEEQQS